VTKSIEVVYLGEDLLTMNVSTNYIEQNLIDLDKGPLPDEVVKALDEAWEVVRPMMSKYWH